MRLPSFLVLLVACSSSSSSPSGTLDAAGGGDGGGVDGPGALTCGTTIASYCSANACQLSLDGAKQDKTLCPASLTPCGDYDVVVKGGLDTRTTYYYFQTRLVAVGHAVLPMPTTCVAGPSTFSPPTCTQPSQTLPACQ